MSELVPKSRPVRELIRIMPDDQRVWFIANKFISVWEYVSHLDPGTLTRVERRYWFEQAEKLVYAAGGHRDPDDLFSDAYEMMKPYLPEDDQVSIFNILADVSTLFAEVAMRSVGTAAESAAILGAGAYEGSKAVISKLGSDTMEFTTEKIGEAMESFVGRYENVAYLSIAAGLIGTTVLYFRSQGT